MSTSGGIIYHLRAYRYGKSEKNSLWATHVEGTRKFLEAWSPRAKILVLIGPSGAYSIPKNFLSRFERIIAVEPDGMARLIFEKRFELKPEWIKTAVSFHDLKSLKALVPEGSAILFSNVLGQVSLPRISDARRELKSFLANHSWASYHDALSGEQMQFDWEVLAPQKKATLAEMKGCVFPMANRETTLTVNAHEAPDLFPADPKLSFRYWQWMIVPKRAHLIEGVFYNLPEPSLHETDVNV